MKTTWLLAVLTIVGASPAEICAKEVPLELITIDPDPPERPWYKMVGDVSGDGLPDIVVASGTATPMVAYVNPTWEKKTIALDGWQGVNGEIGDIDGDGDADIVMGGVVWFENPGNLETRWTMHRIDNQKMHDIELADVDQNGRLDVVGRDQSAFKGNGNAVFVYLQQTDGSWAKESLPCPHGEGIKLGDIDQDGDPDILLGGLWFENMSGAEKRWIKHRYTSQWTEDDAKVDMADINDDGRYDIVLAPAELKGETYRVCWYEAPKDLQSNEWTEHVLVNTIECVIHALGVGDFDLDGDIDVAFAEMHQGRDPDEVSLYINRGNGKKWTQQVLSDRGSHDFVVVDIDNDQDLDIIGANHGAPNPLELWKNQTINSSPPK